MLIARTMVSQSTLVVAAVAGTTSAALYYWFNTRKSRLPLPPGPPRWTKLSVESFVYCFERRPAPPNPNFLSRAVRGSLDLAPAPPGPDLARFEGWSAIASSTATSKSSPPPSAPSSAPLRSVKVGRKSARSQHMRARKLGR